jgi:NDP-sugar pyrophosphorylase family protein
VQIGAVLTVSEAKENEIDFPALSIRGGRKRQRLVTRVPDNTVTVLGNNLGERIFSKLREVGVSRPTVIAESDSRKQSSWPQVLGGEESGSAWEQAIAHWVRENAEVLLLIRGNAFTNLDFTELLQFHIERKGALTQVYAADGYLDIAVVNAAVLRENAGTYKTTLTSLLPQHERFFHRGYVNRLRTPADFMQLIEDGLQRRCELRPIGTEIASGVWLGEGAEVEASCVISSPAFIGAGTRVGACCTVSAGSAVEHACEVDSGTSIEQSWILPGTYVGVGLTVRRSVVSNKKLFNVDRNAEVEIPDRRLIGATHSVSLFGAGGGFSDAVQTLMQLRR